MDHCCACSLNDGSPAEGQAWLTVGRIYRTGPAFPAGANFEDKCALNAWGVDLTLGVYRCAATLAENGDPPPCAALEADSEALLSDMAALRQVLTCCFPPVLAALGGGRHAIGDITPISPSGACMGSQAVVTVEFYDCCPDT